MVAVAIGAVLFFTLGRGDENGKAPATKSTLTAKDSKEAKAKKEAKAERRKEKQLLDALALDFTRDPAGNWSGFLPTGPGWSEPTDRGNQNDEYVSARYLTTLDGPDGDFVGVDTTPDVDPTADPNNFIVNGKQLRKSGIPTGSMAEAYLVTFTNGSDECEDIFCAKAVLKDGADGGIAIVAGSRTPTKAIKIVREFAGRIQPRY